MHYKTYSFNTLNEIVSKHTAVEIVESNSGAMLFSEYGARLLGMFPKLDASNTLFVHKNLDAHFTIGDWKIGGERLWIAPEREYYFENPRDFEGFHVPAVVDPGEYNVSDNLTYVNRLSLLNLVTNELHDSTEFKRVFTPISDPYNSGGAFVGVSIHDSITVKNTTDRFAAWSLTQVYSGSAEHPGTVLIPLAPSGSPLHYFRAIPTDRLLENDGCLSFRIDGSDEYKIAVSPEDARCATDAQMAYLCPYPENDLWFCIIKSSQDVPSTQDTCVDTPRSDPQGPKGAIQSYNANCFDLEDGDDSQFGEIELQMSKNTTKDGTEISSGTHQLLSYAGTRDEMIELAKTALKLETMPTLF